MIQHEDSSIEVVSPSVHASDAEEIRIGYQGAIALWTYEGTLIWSKFNAMLVANSVVVAVIGFSMDKGIWSGIPRGLSALGFVLCFLWYALTKRGFDNYLYWIFAARELESHLGDQVATVSRGGAFADGDEVDFVLEGDRKHYRMSPFSRSLTAGSASYLVICVFAAMYGVFLLASWARIP